MRPKLRLLPGTIMVSEPFLQDDYFHRSVVLLTNVEKRGCLGFILNKPTNQNIDNCVEDFPVFESILHYGGPIETENLFYIHTIKDLKESTCIQNDIYYGGKYEDLKNRILEGRVFKNQIRFYAGYAGWTFEELMEDFNQKIWIPTDLKREFLFRNDYSNLWSQVLQNMGGDYATLANYPEDPQWN